MLSPHLPFVSWLCSALFFAMLGFLAWRAASKDRREYQRFKRYRSTVRRQAMYRKWLRESFLTFATLAVILLVLIWQFIPLLLNGVNGWDWVRELRAWYSTVAWFATPLLLFVVLVLPVLLLFFARKQDDITAIGDIQALLPRNRAEVRIGALLSLNAGVVEELLFRLALPALAYAAFGNAFFALLASSVVFGSLHMYQGLTGIIGTTIVGVFLLAIYIGTGSILAAIVVHVLIDLRSFVFIPLIVLRVPRV